MERHDEDLTTRDIAGASATTETETEERADVYTDTDTDTEVGPLLGDTDQRDFQSRWADVQTRFVDDPRRAVEDADELVAAVMKRLADGFAEEREHLETVWSRGEDVGTEDLRVALQRYRAFFHRLLST